MEIFKKKFLISWIILLTIPFFCFSQKKEGVPTVKLFDKEYYKFEVKKHATIYSICKTFEISEEDLISMNPFLADGLKTGQTLLIPVEPKNAANEQTAKVEKKVDKTKKSSTIFLGKKSTALIPERLPRVSLLLPFSVSESTGINDRYLEFYEGFLLAVDSLKSMGLSFEVQAINVGNGDDIDKILKSGKLAETDYCIGGTTSEQISALAEWASYNRKILILPFSSRIPEMKSNPWLYQTNTSYDYMYKKFSEYAAAKFSRNKIIFLKSKDQKTNENNGLIPYLKNQLGKKGIPYSEVPDDEELSQLKMSFSDYKDNLVIPYQMPVNESSNFISKLSSIAAQDTSLSISLLGYPEWQALNRKYIRMMHSLNTYIFSNFYADSNKSNVKVFQNNFKNNYGKNLLNTYPKYGMMGYDIASWFIPKMVYEKSTEQIKKGPAPIQNAFLFKPLNPGSGSYNQVFYIVNYTQKNTVEVKQLK